MAVVKTECTCGTEVEIRSGVDADNRYRADGKQAVYPGESGYSIFRCQGCGEPLAETVPAFAYEDVTA